MKDEISWHIGNDEENGRVDTSPVKAYFYWRKDGKVVRSSEFTKNELLIEIDRLRTEGSDSSVFEEALRKL